MSLKQGSRNNDDGKYCFLFQVSTLLTFERFLRLRKEARWGLCKVLLGKKLSLIYVWILSLMYATYTFLNKDFGLDL